MFWPYSETWGLMIQFHEHISQTVWNYLTRNKWWFRKSVAFLINRFIPGYTWFYSATRVLCMVYWPIASMYGIFAYIYHKKSTKYRYIYHTWMLWVRVNRCIYNWNKSALKTLEPASTASKCSIKASIFLHNELLMDSCKVGPLYSWK